MDRRACHIPSFTFEAIANREVLDAKAFETSLVPLIEGLLDIEDLDIFGQETLQNLTRSLIDCFAQFEANRTDCDRVRRLPCRRQDHPSKWMVQFALRQQVMP